jgi:hypothetical protein
MAIHVALNHKTHYLYGRRVNLGPQIVRLRKLRGAVSVLL